MSLPERYRAALDAPPEAVVLALLPEDTTEVGVTEAQRRLRAGVAGVTGVSVAAERHSRDARWELTIDLDPAVSGGARRASAWLEPAPRGLAADLGAHGVGKSDLAAAEASQWAIGVSARLAESPLAAYHRQLCLLDALAPGAALILDTDALSPRSGEWLRQVAGCAVPPSPHSLFTIHCVCGDDSDRAWLHTHGLLRCGSVELEMVDMPVRTAGLFGQLVNAVAGLFLDEGIPEPGEPFEIGRDLVLAWLPWEEGIRKVGGSAPGGKRDRDGSHDGPSGILFAPRRGLFGRKLDSPAVYAPALEDNPMLYVSTAETQRMTALARERWPRFARLVAAFRGQPAFTFLVKLGYPMDGCEDGSEREHLWFEALEAETGEGRVKARLVNAPYHVGHLSEGDVGCHDLDLLSDWVVLTEVGRFGPDNLHELERRLTIPPPKNP